MCNFEEALHNIDVFCKVLARKIAEGESEAKSGARSGVAVEPMEKLLYRKYVVSEQVEPSLAKHMIPLPQLEEPLIDVFENENYVKIVMQCRCREQKITIRKEFDGIEICNKLCYKNDYGNEVCIDECRKLNLPVDRLKIEGMITKCNNNGVFEVDIPKQSLNS